MIMKSLKFESGMKHVLIILFSLAVCSPANARKGPAENLFRLHGKLLELDIVKGANQPAADLQVIVYQNREIYAAFKSSADGSYEFYLPLGFEYEVSVGGTSHINKKIYIDSRGVKAVKSPHEIVLDIGVFRPVDQYSFELLKEPFVKVSWDEEYNQFAPDLDYTDSRARELEKVFRKIRKSSGSRS
jgi:hypothetical protein